MAVETVERFFQLDRAVYRANKRMVDLDYRFNARSYHTRTTYTFEGIGVESADVERSVIDYLDSRMKLEQTQAQRIEQYRQFMLYMLTLNPKHKAYVIDKYVKGYDVPFNEFLERKLKQTAERIERGSMWED